MDYLKKTDLLINNGSYNNIFDNPEEAFLKENFGKILI